MNMCKMNRSRKRGKCWV